MAKYVSGRQKNLKVGISSYSENLTSLEVIGNGNFTGIVTAGYFSGDGSGLTNLGGSSAVAYADNAGIATYATNAGIATYATNAGIATYATSAGIATYATNAGIATYATNAGIATYATSAGIATYATNAGIATYATSAGIATYATNAGIATYATSAGIATYATNAGIATYATNAGIATYATNAGIATYATNAGIATYATNAGIATNVIGGIASVTQLQVTGVSTFTNGPVLVGTTTATGTASQRLQVDGGAYFSGIGASIGIGTTNPQFKLDVNGDINFNGTFYQNGSQFVASRWASGTGDNIYRLNGNVGVGTTNPTVPLSVIGNANFTGVVTASSFSGNASSSTYADNAGVSTYATSAGIATYATNAGIATYATNAGIATYATNAGVATALEYSRTISLSGDIVGSTTFDGTQNVSIAATIQLNSVALGSDTTGDYVQSISGTENQISVSVISGESTTPTLSIPNQFTIPQDATITRDLQVNRNLNVNGNITIGGTSATLFSQTLSIFDPDIVLGYRTDAFGNDVSNDSTANHGGVALASTEGTPLVDLFIAGIETNPSTYKKIMWFKTGEFAGLGTDAWLFNYAVGIGSTQFPTGTRLAAGNVQFTQDDLAFVRNINASGVITATSGFSGNLSGYASSAGIATNLNGGLPGNIVYQSSSNTTAFLANGTDGHVLRSNGAGNVPTWVSAAPSGAITGITIRDEGDLVGVEGSVTQLDFVGSNISVVSTSGIATIAVSNNLVGTALSISGISTFNNTLNVVPTETSIAGLFSGTTSSDMVRITQFGTGNALVVEDSANPDSNPFVVSADGSVGIGVTNPEKPLHLSSSVPTPLIIQRVSSANAAIEYKNPTSSMWAGLAGNALGWGVAASDNVGSNAQILVTRTGGELLVGSVSTTGTASQRLQVDGGAYVSGNLGIGTTNPTSKLYVVGDGYFTGILTANRIISGVYGEFVGGSISGTNIVGTALSISGISTFTNGPVLVGTTTATGTASQRLQVDGGAYVSDSVGIGTTNPTSALTVVGNGLFSGTGIVTATSFSGSGTNLTGIVTSIVAGTNITVSDSTGQFTINAAGGLDILEVMLFA